MGNGQGRSKRETFMEEKLHYPEWIDAIKEEDCQEHISLKRANKSPSVSQTGTFP